MSRRNFSPTEATYMQKSVADVCLSCKRPECNGVPCAAYQEAYENASRIPGHTAVIYVVDGEAHTLYEWAAIIGVNYKTLHSRIRSGMSPRDVLYSGRIGRRK